MHLHGGEEAIPMEVVLSGKPRQNFRYTARESTRPYLATSARRATRAAQRREKALEASESRSSNLRSYTDPVWSA
jgi:hypothetical protein